MNRRVFSNVSGDEEPMQTPPTTAQRRKEKQPRSPITTRASTRALRPPHTDTEDNGESRSRERIIRSTTVTPQETDEDRDATEEAEDVTNEPRTPTARDRSRSSRSMEASVSIEDMKTMIQSFVQILERITFTRQLSF